MVNKETFRVILFCRQMLRDLLRDLRLIGEDDSADPTFPGVVEKAEQILGTLNSVK